MGDTMVGVCHRLPDQEEASEAFFRQLEETSHSQAVALLGILNYPDTCWMGNTAEDEQSRRFLNCIDTLNGFLEYTDAFNFLTQVNKKYRERRRAAVGTLLKKED